MWRAVVFDAALALLLLPLSSRPAPQNAQLSMEFGWPRFPDPIPQEPGYSFQFPAQVRDGVLRGERLSPGRPGLLMLSGTIRPDGSADISA
jgi:hypothetical protein